VRSSVQGYRPDPLDAVVVDLDAAFGQFSDACTKEWQLWGF
jgi:hypothetical protein